MRNPGISAWQKLDEWSRPLMDHVAQGNRDTAIRNSLSLSQLVRFLQTKCKWNDQAMRQLDDSPSRMSFEEWSSGAQRTVLLDHLRIETSICAGKLSNAARCPLSFRNGDHQKGWFSSKEQTSNICLIFLRSEYALWCERYSIEKEVVRGFKGLDPLQTDN